MEISTIGLDLAKNVFQVHGIDATGEVVWTCNGLIPAT
jgi:transposase